MKTRSLTNDLGLKKTRSPTKDQGLKKTTPRPETPLLVSRLKTGLVLLSQHLHLHLQICLHPHAERELGRANKLPKKTKNRFSAMWLMRYPQSPTSGTCLTFSFLEHASGLSTPDCKQTISLDIADPDFGQQTHIYPQCIQLLARRKTRAVCQIRNTPSKGQQPTGNKTPDSQRPESRE